VISRRNCARVLRNFSPSHQAEGAGKAGCALHPRSRVQDAQKNAHTSIQVQRRQSGLPCAMVLRLISCSSRRSGLFVTVVLRNLARSAPGWADLPPRDLTPASRRQNHTTSPSAAVFAKAFDGRGTHPPKSGRRRLWHRSSARSVIAHGRTRPATFRAPDAAASTASRPNVRDDGQRPSPGTGRGSCRVIWVFGKSEYFFERDWTRGAINCPGDLPVGCDRP
jgi:hypothetical protein